MYNLLEVLCLLCPIVVIFNLQRFYYAPLPYLPFFLRSFHFFMSSNGFKFSVSLPEALIEDDALVMGTLTFICTGLHRQCCCQGRMGCVSFQTLRSCDVPLLLIQLQLQCKALCQMQWGNWLLKELTVLFKTQEKNK